MTANSVCVRSDCVNRDQKPMKGHTMKAKTLAKGAKATAPKPAKKVAKKASAKKGAK